MLGGSRVRVTVLAPAKINLYLEVLKKTPQTMHDIETIMQTVSLFDVIRIEYSRINLKTNKINLQSNSKILNELPVEKNLVYVACKEFFRYSHLSGYSFRIHVEKNIPINAGLAGGSTDAAAVLVGLNYIFCKTCNILNIARKIGSDVPFCIWGGAALALSTGTELTKLKSMENVYILICKPFFDVCTKAAYKKFDDKYGNVEYTKRDVHSILDAISRGKFLNVANNLYNRFEEIIDSEEVEYIKGVMKQYGALSSLMTGSGSAVFGIFEDERSAKNCENELRNSYTEVFLCNPLTFGCKLLAKN